MISDQVLITLIASVTSIITGGLLVLGAQWLQNRAKQPREGAEIEDIRQDIGAANVDTALKLIAQVRAENTALLQTMDNLRNRASTFEKQLIEAYEEITKLRLKIIDRDADLFARDRGEKMLYHQIKSKGETPNWTPPNISGKLKDVNNGNE